MMIVILQLIVLNGLVMQVSFLKTKQKLYFFQILFTKHIRFVQSKLRECRKRGHWSHVRSVSGHARHTARQSSSGVSWLPAAATTACHRCDRAVRRGGDGAALRCRVARRRAAEPLHGGGRCAVGARAGS